jgi:hypothetical protein
LKEHRRFLWLMLVSSKWGLRRWSWVHHRKLPSAWCSLWSGKCGNINWRAANRLLMAGSASSMTTMLLTTSSSTPAWSNVPRASSRLS